MGETDKILARYGVKGLYNGEYFSFSPPLCGCWTAL